MTQIHKIVMIHMGTPPTAFTWSYTDKKKKFHSMEDTTPQEFYKAVCPDVTTKISLINDPRNECEGHCLSLNFHCLSLTFHCLSLTFHCLSLTFHCLSLTFHCLP